MNASNTNTAAPHDAAPRPAKHTEVRNRMDESRSFRHPEDFKRWGTLALGIGGIGFARLGRRHLFERRAGTSLVAFRVYFLGRHSPRKPRTTDASIPDGRSVGCSSARRFFEAGTLTCTTYVVFLLRWRGDEYGQNGLPELTQMAADDHFVLHRGWYMNWGWWIDQGVCFIFFCCWGVVDYLHNKVIAQRARGSRY